MSKKEKFWYLIGPIMMSFVFAATSPTIHVYFVNLIEPRILALANMIGTGLSAFVNYTIPKERMKDWYRNHFLWIVVLDCICFWGFSFFGYEHPEVRFIGFSIINAVSTCLWVMVMRNLANNIITDGDMRTDFDALNSYTTLTACLCGAAIAFFASLSVEICLIAQCLVNVFMGVADLHAFKLLNAKIKEGDKHKDYTP